MTEDRRGRLFWEQCFQTSKNNIKNCSAVFWAVTAAAPAPKRSSCVCSRSRDDPGGTLTQRYRPGGRLLHSHLPYSTGGGRGKKLPHLSDFDPKNLPEAHVESKNQSASLCRNVYGSAPWAPTPSPLSSGLHGALQNQVSPFVFIWLWHTVPVSAGTEGNWKSDTSWG